ncbi:MAG: hypothetical protein QOE55_1437 [Acidobacteriaceae bacterium]|jgi:hypothetical protein|nr:hypothetical protein [Acidobacteriaceae bacterium]
MNEARLNRGKVLLGIAQCGGRYVNRVGAEDEIATLPISPRSSAASAA